MEKLKSFSQYMQQLARRNSISNVFIDFLEMSVCALSLGAMETRYLEIVGRYDKQEVNSMADAFAALVMEMDNHGEGLRDILGDFFMEHISHGHNGQFFTPEPICEMMARMTNPIEPGSRVLDCACGSGRTLLAAAEINRNASFYGADVDRNCAMMCLINFCLNGMLGEVAWMNSLSNEFFGAWQIRLHPTGGVPYIVPITEAESVIVLKLPVHNKKIINVPMPEQRSVSKADVLAELIESVPVKAQQLLFNF
ncbi:MAG: SAM-dependent DNA methyltransferase [Prolixibacteraceae bacterium]|nr:SAM-dependent DNA methyltransferase [Prolixibacteraceae bacterium]